MNEAVRLLLERAEHALEVAETLRREGFHPESASRTYYAMFYAASLLISEGVEVTKHSAVESELGRRFAKTGRLDTRYHRMLINARRTREIADYDIQEEIVEPVATLRSEEGREFVGVIRRMLEE